MNKKKVTTAREGFKDLMGETVKKTIQKVNPIYRPENSNQEADLTQLMVWVPTDLMVKIKTKTVIEKRSMKEIVTEILEKYL